MQDIGNQLVCQAFAHNRRLKVEIELQAFRDHPLGVDGYNSPSTRGIAIENMVREVDSLLHPGATHVENMTYNSPCDWHRSELRIECKHSRTAWARNSWRSNILAFDRCR